MSGDNQGGGHPTTLDKMKLIFSLFFQISISFEGVRAILRVTLDGAGFFMTIGVESMPQYGLEVVFMKFSGHNSCF